MNQSTVNSSDLALARTLTEHLALHQEGEQPRAMPALADSGYRRFKAFVSAAAPVGAAAPAATAPPLPLEPPELQSWDDLLAWSMKLCSSRAGFVVDSQGFVIACRGNVPDDGFEGMGAELCFAMEQMAKLDPEGADLQAVDLQFESKTLTSIRIAGKDDSDAFILGFIGARALQPEARNAIIQQGHLAMNQMV